MGAMRIKIAIFLVCCIVPFAAFARREGTPIFYQNSFAAWQQMPNQHGQNVFVGSQPNRQVVGQNVQTFHMPRQVDPWQSGGMTMNGISMPPDLNPYNLRLSATYSRRYADFQFKTGVNSILDWSNMVFNEIGFRAERDFQLRDFNMFAFGEYSRGTMSHGGLSMDYDLEPFDHNFPTFGIFTISVGQQTGTIQNFRVGLGARHIWDVSGWKLSPSIGYQVFRHDLQMFDHIYPNPAVYIPLMNQHGDYIFGDLNGNYFSVPPGMAVPDGFFQICMSPEDLRLAASDLSTWAPILDSNGNLITVEYNPAFGNSPWGVGPGECVVIGGDGMIQVRGTTHIYNTAWSGLFLGLEIEKQMTFVDRLRFYAQVSLPHYRAEGIWPNRTDWQQNPSFLDEGSNGSLHYQLEMEYIHRLSDRLELSLRASTEYFHVGQIPGDLYVAGYNFFITDEFRNIIIDDNGLPLMGFQPPFTEKISEALTYATWQSFSLHLGVRYAF